VNKFLISALVISSALAAPALAFAQDNDPITRAQVGAELVQLEKAGYNPGVKDNNYPQRIQATEQRVAEEQSIASSSYGMPTNGTSASSIAPANDAKSIYVGH
jgi:Domain of unknown function (DUF4148)